MLQGFHVTRTIGLAAKVHNVVPQSELMAKENAMTEMEEEISMMKMRLQNIEDWLSQAS